MSKREFLEQLRQALDGEVDPITIDQNISYYDGYISGDLSKSEENILESLGDPRLIAKTIIETERIAREKGKFHYTRDDANNHNYNNGYQDADHDNATNQRTTHNTAFFGNIKWYHKAILFAVAILMILALLFIGRIIFRLIYVFAVPILLILLLISVFRKR